MRYRAKGSRSLRVDYIKMPKARVDQGQRSTNTGSNKPKEAIQIEDLEESVQFFLSKLDKIENSVCYILAGAGISTSRGLKVEALTSYISNKYIRTSVEKMGYKRRLKKSMMPKI